MSWPTSSDHLCFPRAIMVCHNRRDPFMSVVQGPCAHAMPDIVLSCVLSNVDDNVPRPTSSYHVCFPNVIMACHARCRPTVCNAQRRLWHTTPMSSNYVCCPKVIMAYDALRHPTMCIAQGPCRQTMIDIIISYVLPREMLACQAQHCPTVYPAQGPCGQATPYILRLRVQS